MKPVLITCLLIFTVLSCKVERNSDRKLLSTALLKRGDTINVIVEGVNLSEDMSIFSTQNDELFIFIYNYRFSSQLASPLFVDSVILDTANLVNKSHWILNEDLDEGDLIFFLIESDSERPIGQIDTLIRQHHAELIKHFETLEYSALETYLGDDDLLGVEIFSSYKLIGTHTFNISGVHRMDKYEYIIRLNEKMATQK